MIWSLAKASHLKEIKFENLPPEPSMLTELWYTACPGVSAPVSEYIIPIDEFTKYEVPQSVLKQSNQTNVPLLTPDKVPNVSNQVDKRNKTL